MEEIEELGLRGSWLKILEKTTTNLKTELKPDELLINLTLKSLSLLKLRRYSDSLSNLQHISLHDPTYLYDTYPSLYPNKSGSMIPFALRWLLSVLPSYVGDRSLSLHRLYSLLSFVNHKIHNPTCFIVWERRRLFVINSIVSLHLSNKEFSPALALLRFLLTDHPFDPVFLSKLGYMQMQIGDLEGAKSTFSKVEGLVDNKLDEVWARNLVGRNKALGYLVGKDYSSAVREYEECVERDAADVVAVNNKAICLMYLRELSGSISVLEGALERVPTVALNEPIVVNLCSMYELAYVNHLDIKKTLSSWIAKVAPDDFDTSCTRI